MTRRSASRLLRSTLNSVLVMVAFLGLLVAGALAVLGCLGLLAAIGFILGDFVMAVAP